MDKATKFKNARIIALDAGTFVGTVERLILDLDSRTVAGLLLEGGTRAIDGEELQSLGEDAVTIRTASTIIELNQATELAECIKGEDEVYKKEVFTVAGKKIGFITDVLIDTDSRSIVGFDMFSEFLFKDDVHGVVLLNEQVIFGRDLVLVPADVESLVANATVNVDYLTAPVQPIQQSQVQPIQQSQGHPTQQSQVHPMEDHQIQTFATSRPDIPVHLKGENSVQSLEPETQPFGLPQVLPAGQPSAPQPEVSPGTQPMAQPLSPEAQPFGLPQVPVPGELEVLPDINPSTAIDFTGSEPQSIDFSGVQAPQPEVIHRPSEVVAANETGERPDMVQLFQNFPIGNESPVGQPVSSASQEAPFSLFPGEEITGGAIHVSSGSEPVPDVTSAVKPSPKDKLIGFVLGKTSSRDVVDVDGNVILETGATITDEVVAAAQAAELMPQVFLAASQGLHSRFKRRR